MLTRLTRPILVVTLIFWLGLSLRPSQAATFVIANGDVAGLIAAINAANDETANPGPDTIDLAAGGSYVLTAVVDPDGAGTGPTGLPLINTSITINGNGATISRDPLAPEFRFFVTFDVAPDLTLNNLTLTGGSVTSSLNFGGAMMLGSSEGKATLNQVTVTNNQAEAGGGLVTLGGTVNISNSIVSGNSAPISSGGGIFNGGGIMTITNSTITGNSGGYGTGIANGHVLTIINSTIADNSGEGGSLNNTNGSVRITNSTFSNNTSSSGAAIVNASGEMEIINADFIGNSSPEGVGAALYNEGNMSVLNSTFSNNNVGLGTCAAIYNGVNGILSIQNSTFTNNTGELDDICNYGSLTIKNSTIDGNPTG